MITVAGQRSFALGVVPRCGAEHIIVNILARPINQADWGRITLAQMENIGVFGNSFVGTVIIVGQDILHRGFKLGDTVAGYIEAGLWVDILDGRSQEYLQIQPDKVWHICSTEMKRMGFVDSAMGDGCTII